MITLTMVLVATTVVVPSPCAKAASLLTTPETYDQAEAAFNALRAARESDPCVSDGLARLQTAWMAAQRKYAEGKQLEANKAIAEARERYLAALRIDPRFADAATRLALLGRAEDTDPYLE